ncbi:hypothetical protein ACIBUY_04140 [Streptomyces sp. NPDC050085]|uniref:hypothetical protein n=1 Tax=Streptomyces sp. NPDC050085 TaxID=3365600 RepID=UPI00378A7E9C
MLNRPLNALSALTSTWSVRRRVITGLVVLVALGALALAGAFLARGPGTPDGEGHAAPPAATAPGTPSAPSAAASGQAVARPPQLSDPLAYARAAADLLWSYDTRTTSRSAYLAGLDAWMTRESRYADPDALHAQVPDPVLWSRMADNRQYATAHVREAHYPSAFKEALADHPAQLTTAYIYAVTVSGTQQVTWKDGGAGAEERSITLAVQCRPGHDCALVSVAPTVAP